MPKPKLASNVTDARIEFGLWLKNVRKGKGWSQAQVQGKLLVDGREPHERWLAEREQGRVVLSHVDAVALAEVYGFGSAALADLHLRARRAQFGPDAIADLSPPSVGDESTAEKQLRVAMRRLSSRLGGADLLAQLAVSSVAQWERSDDPILRYIDPVNPRHVEAHTRAMSLLIALRGISGAAPAVQASFIDAISLLARAFQPADLSHGRERAMANVRQTESEVRSILGVPDVPPADAGLGSTTGE